MHSIVEEVNDKHMGPWAEICKDDGIENSPLSPYIDQELLYNKHLYLHPGKLLEQTGFTYLYPKLTKESLKDVSTFLYIFNFSPLWILFNVDILFQVIDDYVDMKIFPHSIVL